jgi:hypothetical protein
MIAVDSKQLRFGCIIAILAFRNISHAFSPTKNLTALVYSHHRASFNMSSSQGALLEATAIGRKKNNAPCLALEATSGRNVEMEIANVGGEPGKKGTVRIQLRPEWAPLGVSRFEVSFFVQDSCVFPNLGFV